MYYILVILTRYLQSQITKAEPKTNRWEFYHFWDSRHKQKIIFASKQEVAKKYLATDMKIERLKKSTQSFLNNKRKSRCGNHSMVN